jgi:uncharacterized membrane protein YhhN
LIGLTAGLSVLALGSAVTTIVAELRDLRRLVYVVKPLTVIAILIIAARALPSFAPPYKAMVLAGLGCSLVGDVFLMLRKKRFLEGLIAFLAAQLFYCAAFRSGAAFSLSSLPMISFVVFGLLMIRLLLPHLGTMKFPVTIYVFVIVTMAALAAERFIQLGGSKTLCAFAGAVLFIVSDSSLAIDRFMKKIKYAQALILGTYFVAQWLIAMSV